MTILLDKTQLELTITRLAHQILEQYPHGNVVLLGIQKGGVPVSDRLAAFIRKQLTEGNSLLYGKMDITFYRDDIRKELHSPHQTEINFSMEGKTVILVDDVLHTGRTIRAALDALLDYGRPGKVELCVLVDRKFGREFPIQPDYCGKKLDAAVTSKVKVNWDTEEVVLF